MTEFGWLVVVAAALLVGWLVFRSSRATPVSKTSYTPAEPAPIAEILVATAVTAQDKKPATKAPAKKATAKKASAKKISK